MNLFRRPRVTKGMIFPRCSCVACHPSHARERVFHLFFCGGPPWASLIPHPVTLTSISIPFLRWLNLNYIAKIIRANKDMGFSSTVQLDIETSSWALTQEERFHISKKQCISCLFHKHLTNKRKSTSFTILFIRALNWAIDVSVADSSWQSQTHVNLSPYIFYSQHACQFR